LIQRHNQPLRNSGQPRDPEIWRPRLGPGICRLWLIALLALACADEGAPPATPSLPPAEPQTLWVEIAGEPFELELAIDPQIRVRGLGGRFSIAQNGGMLFVNSVLESQAMVMRDCPIAIDVAFLDSSGRVVAIHAMRPELPRRPDESFREYESRLPRYASGAPALFAVETAGGRMRQLGLQVGDRLVFDIAGLLERARRTTR
jgi:hypothetical protein